MAIRWTLQITGRGPEQDFAAWGICNPERTALNQCSDAFGFDLIGDIDGEEIFIEGDEIKVRYYVDDVATTWFVGYRTDHLREGSPKVELRKFKFASPWDYFMGGYVFHQAWKVKLANGTESTDYFAEVVLGKLITGDRITLADTLTEIFNYVIGQTIEEYGSAKLKLGDVFPAFYVPLDAANNQMAAETVRQCLRWLGSTNAWIDYSTTPPTVHCKTRDKLTPMTLTINGSNGAKIKRRDDLIPTAIAFRYRITSDVNGQKFTSLVNDIACEAGSTTSLGVTDPALLPFSRRRGVAATTFDFQGSSRTVQANTLAVSAIDLNSVDFWKAVYPHDWDSLQDFSIVGVPTIKGDQGLGLTRYLVGNTTQIADWQNYASEELIVSAKIKCNKVDGTVKLNSFDASARIMSTNAPLGTNTEFNSQGGEQPEQVPYGLAKQIYDIEKIPQFEGTISFTQEEVSGFAISLGNVLNLAGGLAEWETMNAQIQRIDYDLEAGTTTITFGPALHLGAGDIIERLRVQRGLRQVNFMVSNRGSSSAGSSSLSLGGKSALKDNATSGLHDYQDQQFSTPATGQSGANATKSFAIVVNSSNAQQLMESKLSPSIVQTILTADKHEVKLRSFPVSVKLNGTCKDGIMFGLFSPIYDKTTGAVLYEGI